MKSSSQGRKPELLSYFRTSKPITKADIVLLSIIIMIAVLAIVFSYTLRPTGDRAEIYINGDMVGTYSLQQDKVIKYDIGITVNIHEGKIAVIESDCPDQICVHMGTISKTGERIICAPNKFVIVIRGQNSGYDAITGRRQND